MSLFGDRQLIEVCLGVRKPDKKGTAVLAELLEQPNGDDILLIQAEKLDRQNQKAKWFKAFEKHATVVQARLLAGRDFERWISARAGAKNLKLARDAIELIAMRAEGNMLAASQEIEKLALQKNILKKPRYMFAPPQKYTAKFLRN